MDEQPQIVSQSMFNLAQSFQEKNNCVQWHVGGRHIITSAVLAPDLMRLCQTVCLRKQNNNHLLVLFCVLAYWFSCHIFPVFRPGEEPTAARTTIKWKHKSFDRLLCITIISNNYKILLKLKNLKKNPYQKLKLGYPVHSNMIIPSPPF